MVEAGGHQSREFRFIKRQARSDQVDIESGGASRAHEIDNVSAGERFAAREISLQNAELGGFLKNAGPGFRGELVGTGLQFERIRTIDAMERAAVGEFRDEGQGIGWCFVHWELVKTF